MQPAVSPPNSGRVIIRYSLNFGLIQAVIGVSILLLNAFVYRGAGLALLLLSGADFFLNLVMYFGVGILASKQTGRLSTGLLASLLTGIFFEAIVFIVNLAISIFSAGPNTFQASPILLEFELLGSWPVIVLSVGLGALGGLIGRSKSPFRLAPAVPVYPSYPVQPQQPYTPSYVPAPPQPAPQASPDLPGDQPHMEHPH